MNPLLAAFATLRSVDVQLVKVTPGARTTQLSYEGQRLELSREGLRWFQGERLRASLPADAIQTVTLTGTPRRRDVFVTIALTLVDGSTLPLAHASPLSAPYRFARILAIAVRRPIALQGTLGNTTISTEASERSLMGRRVKDATLPAPPGDCSVKKGSRSVDFAVTHTVPLSEWLGAWVATVGRLALTIGPVALFAWFLFALVRASTWQYVPVAISAFVAAGIVHSIWRERPARHWRLSASVTRQGVLHWDIARGRRVERRAFPLHDVFVVTPELTLMGEKEWQKLPHRMGAEQAAWLAESLMLAPSFLRGPLRIAAKPEARIPAPTGVSTEEGLPASTNAEDTGRERAVPTTERSMASVEPWEFDDTQVDAREPGTMRLSHGEQRLRLTTGRLVWTEGEETLQTLILGAEHSVQLEVSVRTSSSDAGELEAWWLELTGPGAEGGPDAERCWLRGEAQSFSAAVGLARDSARVLGIAPLLQCREAVTALPPVTEPLTFGERADTEARFRWPLPTGDGCEVEEGDASLTFRVHSRSGWEQVLSRLVRERRWRREVRVVATLDRRGTLRWKEEGMGGDERRIQLDTHFAIVRDEALIFVGLDGVTRLDTALGEAQRGWVADVLPDGLRWCRARPATRRALREAGSTADSRRSPSP